MEHDCDGDTSCNWCTWNDRHRFRKRFETIGNQWKNREHPNYSIIKIGQNIEKSPVDLRRLALPQTPGKKHQLTLV